MGLEFSDSSDSNNPNYDLWKDFDASARVSDDPTVAKTIGTHKISPLELLREDETTEIITRIETLFGLQNDEDHVVARELVSEFLLDWTGKVFSISGEGFLRDGFESPSISEKIEPEFFDAEATFQGAEIREFYDDAGKFCAEVVLVFWPEEDIVDNPDDTQVPLSEIVFAPRNIIRLDELETEKNNIDNLRDFSDPNFFMGLALSARKVLGDFLRDKNLADENRQNVIALAAGSVRAQTEIKEYCKFFQNRTMDISARRWFFVLETENGETFFDEDLCAVDQTSDTAFQPSGLFSGFVCLEELNPTRDPDVISLCYHLRTKDGAYLVPLADLLRAPACDWHDDAEDYDDFDEDQD